MPPPSAAGSSPATASTSSSSTSPTTTTPRTRKGPDAAHAALARCDDAVGTLIGAAGGADEFLERYAVLLCSDHGQTTVAEVARLQDAFPGETVTASNRAGMVYTGTIRARSRGVWTAIRRRGRALARGRRGGRAAGRGRAAVHARGSERRRVDPRPPRRDRAAWAALANPNAGELIVSATPAGSSPTSPAAITPAAGLTGRWRSGTPRCRCSPSVSTSCRRRSSR